MSLERNGGSLNRFWLRLWRPGWFVLRVYWVLGGRGITVRRLRLHPAVFSERFGYTRCLDLFGWRATYLRAVVGSQKNP